MKPTTTMQTTLKFQPDQQHSSSPASGKRAHPKDQDPPATPEIPSDHVRKRNRINSNPSVPPSLPTPSNIPLAERVRPKSIEEFKGQTHLKSTLKTLVTSGHSLVLWGPSGSGKTTLARCLKNLLNQQENSSQKYEFYELSATDFSTNEWKKIIQNYPHLSDSTTTTSGSNQKISHFYKSSSPPSIPIIFIDEVQRLNKSQQDLFLPFIEKGRMIMIFATTENPSFRLTTPLLSRCRLLKLTKHTPDDVKQIIQRALEIENSSLSSPGLQLDPHILDLLCNIADGDARVALSNLQLIIHVLQLDPDSSPQALKEIIGKKSLVYDRNGDNHYELISALHKSVRGGDANAALYWLARMLEGGEDPLYVARRLIRMASEDIGLANPSALTHAVSAYQATQLIGMPECDCILAQVAVMLAESPKSVRTYKAYKQAKALVNSLPSYPVPIHLRNAPTKMMSDLGYGAEYKYEPDYAHPIYQEFMPSEVAEKGPGIASSDEVSSLYPPFLVPASQRTYQQGPSAAQDHDCQHLPDAEEKVQVSSKKVDQNCHASGVQPSPCSSKWTTAEGKLVDLELLSQWEDRVNHGKPWIGRDHLHK
ncbi:hypothetical protein PCANC_23929 [Puccinia coronata f. sp. avenae]|uniref:AAA+ ATPase domain-containing protein n=1 Tax=Puccinia coronata f. sp. avenae TaxID=200324 RepID=A0A2N5TX64_9BASI|nr:hypothetical protein PCASD_25961 [Puccinia coronata f. sp. avenae]PLW30093.1 hypothetical protein PCANC_23929 [Puccinia coronata f. sp. avenae]